MRARRGFTLLETSIALAVFAVLIVSAHAVFSDAPRQSAFFVHKAGIDQAERIASNLISQSLRHATTDDMQLMETDYGPALCFSKLHISADGEVTRLGPFLLIAVPVADDPFNHRDDNSNGIVDELCLQIIGPEGQRLVVAPQILPGSFAIELEGGSVLVDYQLFDRYLPQEPSILDGTLVSAANEVVAPRNSDRSYTLNASGAGLAAPLSVEAWQ